MFGSTRKLPSGRWQARYLDDQGNRRTAPWTFDTKREADDWLATVRADLLRGAYRSPEAGAVRLDKYLSDWLATRTDLSPRTRELYTYHAGKWLGRELPSPARAGRTVHIGAMHLRSITVGTVREWYAAAVSLQRANAAARGSRTVPDGAAARAWALANGNAVARTGRLSQEVMAGWETAGKPNAKELLTAEARTSTSQADIAYRLLRTVLGAAVRDGLLPSNPCKIPNAGRTRTRERRPASAEDVRRIAQEMPPRFAAAVEVAAWSGLRAGELFALTRHHIDLDVGAVRVDRAVIEVRGEPIAFGPPKTDSSRRIVHLPQHVVDPLREHLQYFAGGDTADSLVFSRSDGSVLPAHARTAMFARARKRAGRPDLRWHDLRHTGATLAAQAGASLRELQARLGHSTVQAAMLYQHAAEQRDRDIAARLDALARPDAGVTPLRQRAAS
jgi:integrase